MYKLAKVVAFLVILTDQLIESKVYEPCELAKELLHVHKMPRKQILDWVCLVESESSFRTDVMGPPNWDQSNDHGLFQVG